MDTTRYIIDELLPYPFPLEKKEPDNFFYNKVVNKLIPDIIKLKATGIPIDLSQVKNIQDTVDNVLEDVQTKLANNPLMIEFLKDKYNYTKEEKLKAINNKFKDYTKFLVEFKSNNKVHLTYVVNTFLRQKSYTNEIQESWNKRELKILNKVLGTKFLEELLTDIDNFKKHNKLIIDEAMVQLAKDKADIYNKNVTIKSTKKIEDTKLPNFNPGSSKQKQEFFNWLGIVSDTKSNLTGLDKWDRSELEKLSKLLKQYLEE